MKSKLEPKHNDYILELLSELNEIFTIYGNVYLNAYYKTQNKVRVYYDFQFSHQNKLKGSYQKLEVLEFIYYLENM